MPLQGCVDSISVPMHLPALELAGASSSGKNKGKGKATATSSDGTYDVAAGWTEDEREDVKERIRMLALLGYATVLLTASLPPTFNPAKLILPTEPILPELDPRTSKGGASSDGKILQLWRIEVAPHGDDCISNGGGKGPTIYGFSNSSTAAYGSVASVLSLVPSTLNAFSHACLTLSPPSAFSPSILTLDPSLSPRLPYPLRRGPLNQLIRNGMHVELVYRGLTAAGDAGERRRNWISGARELVRVTKGKNIILASGAKDAGEVRAPEDMVNLCELIGLKHELARATLSVNPRAAIARGLSIRGTHKNVIGNPTVSWVPPEDTVDAEGSRKADKTVPEILREGNEPPKKKQKKA